MKIKNEDILNERIEAYNKIQGPRVGDFLRLPTTDERQQDITRFTHKWDESIQTGGSQHHGGYYLGNGYISYSGGLDRGIKLSEIELTDEILDGEIWFFNQGLPGAGRGVQFNMPFRVYKPLPNADLSGIDELMCHFSVCTPENYHYKYVIYERALNHTAFNTPDEFNNWLIKNRLKVYLSDRLHNNIQFATSKEDSGIMI